MHFRLESTVLNEAKDKEYYLIILWDENGSIREQDFSIGQSFEINFEHDQWVRKITHEGSNIVVFVEKDEVFVKNLVGTWAGTINSSDGSFHTEAVYSIEPNCRKGQVCGTYDTPTLGCKGNLVFNGVVGTAFEFTEVKTDTSDYCVNNGTDRFTLYSEDQLGTSYIYNGPEGKFLSSGVLTRK